MKSKRKDISATLDFEIYKSWGSGLDNAALRGLGILGGWGSRRDGGLALTSRPCKPYAQHYNPNRSPQSRGAGVWQRQVSLA